MPRPLPSPAARRARWPQPGWELGVGTAAHLAAAGSARRDSGLFGARAAGPAAGEGGARAGPRCPARKVSWPTKVQLCAAIPGMSGGPGDVGCGAPLPGGREREGGQAGGGGKAAGSGAHPLGAELKSGRAARKRERGPGAGRWRTVASPGLDSPTTKAAAAGEPWGAAGGRTEAGTRRPRVGWGGAFAGRAATALRLLKSEQLPVLRAASGRPARLPESPRTLGRLQELRESHVFKFLWARNLPELQSSTKGRRTRASGSGSRGRGGGRDAREPPDPPRAPRLSLPL